MRSSACLRVAGVAAATAILVGCGEPANDAAVLPTLDQGLRDIRTAADTLRWHEDASFEQVSFPIVEDNVHHDTLLVQVTFDLGDGTYVMVASNQDVSFEGLRLYRYRIDPNGSVDMLAVSSPAYDSWTMLPTFFRAAEEPSTYIVLANFGEKQSWGQKAMILDDNGFEDLRFLDVALPQIVHEPDTTYVKLVNAGPRGRVIAMDEVLAFEFAGDSLFLFDDMQGHKDTIVAARSVRYELKGDELKLLVDGKARVVPKPA